MSFRGSRRFPSIEAFAAAAQSPANRTEQNNKEGTIEQRQTLAPAETAYMLNGPDTYLLPPSPTEEPWLTYFSPPDTIFDSDVLMERI